MISRCKFLFLLPLCLTAGCSAFSSGKKHLSPSPEWQKAAPHLIAASLPDGGDLSFNIKPLTAKSFITAKKPWNGYYAEIDIQRSNNGNNKEVPWVPYSCFIATDGKPPLREIARYNVTPPALSLFYTIAPKAYWYNKAYSKASIWDIFGHAREDDSQSNDSRHNETTAQAKIAMFPDTSVTGKIGSPETYIACIAGTIN